MVKTTHSSNGGTLDSTVTNKRLATVQFLFLMRFENIIVPSKIVRRTCPTTKKAEATRTRRKELRPSCASVYASAPE